MSSSKFEVTLHPDAGTAAVVRGTALACCLLGTAIIAGLLRPWWLAVAVSAAWTVFSVIEYRRWQQGVRQLVQIRLAPRGEVQGLFRNGLWQELTLLPGSTITPQLVWLRLGGGPVSLPGLLFWRGRMPPERWRRLQAVLRNGR
jgi:Membrane-bound toxin component of toxin-antitoxin system